MQNQSHRIISGLTIVLMVLVVAAGWFLIAQPQVAAAQTGGAQLASAETQVQEAQSKIAALRADQDKLPQLDAQLQQLQASIPGDLQAAPFLRQLASQAAAAGVGITDVKVADAVYYAPAAGVATPSTDSASASGSSSTPSPTPSASASAPASTPAAPGSWSPVTDPAITGTNFVTIPVDITFDGGWDNVIQFLTSLQTGPRLYLVTKIQGNGGGASALQTSGLLYATVNPAAASTMTGLTPKKAQATPAPKATPSATPKPTGTPSPTATPNPTKTPSGGDGSTPGE